jgi:hypothetical protein
MEGGLIEAFVNGKFSLACPVYHSSPRTRLAFIVEEGGGLLKSADVWSLADAPAIEKIGAEPVVAAAQMVSSL